MQDEGSALNSNDVMSLLAGMNVHVANCCNHVWPNVVKAVPGVPGVQTLCRKLAKARTDTSVEDVLQEAAVAHVKLGQLLTARKESLSSASRLQKGYPLDGVTTNQLVESSAHMVMPMRYVGPVRALLAINRHQADMFATRNITSTTRLKAGHAVTVHADDVAHANHAKRTQYKVECLSECTAYKLAGVVMKKGMDAVLCSVTRLIGTTGTMIYDCPCLYPQEYGQPCGRLISLMEAGNKKCARLKIGTRCWDNFNRSCFAKRHHQSTLVQQYSYPFVVLPAPALLDAPGSAKSKLIDLLKGLAQGTGSDNVNGYSVRDHLPAAKVVKKTTKVTKKSLPVRRMRSVLSPPRSPLSSGEGLQSPAYPDGESTSDDDSWRKN